jgi:hypothetical protein
MIRQLLVLQRPHDLHAPRLTRRDERRYYTKDQIVGIKMFMAKISHAPNTMASVVRNVLSLRPHK